MIFDAILLAVAPYTSKDEEPSLFLEACNGSVDYRIDAVSVELKRPLGLKKNLFAVKLVKLCKRLVNHCGINAQ